MPRIRQLAAGAPESALALDAREGFYLSSSATRGWTEPAPATSRGHHGFAPDRQAMHASLLLAGPGVTSRGSLGAVTMTLVAPTLARWLGLRLAPEAGQALPNVALPSTSGRPGAQLQPSASSPGPDSATDRRRACRLVV